MTRLSSLALATVLAVGGLCIPATAQEAPSAQSAESSQSSSQNSSQEPSQNQSDESSRDDGQIPIIIGVLAGTAGFVMLANLILNIVNSGKYHTLIPKDFKFS